MGSIESDRSTASIARHDEGKHWNESFVQTAWPLPDRTGRDTRPLHTDGGGGREGTAPGQLHKVNDQSAPGSDVSPPLSKFEREQVDDIVKNARDIAKWSSASQIARYRNETDREAFDKGYAAQDALERELKCLGNEEVKRLLPSINQEIEKDGLRLHFREDGTTATYVDLNSDKEVGGPVRHVIGDVPNKEPDRGCLVN